MKTEVVLIPGFHGSTALFGGFIALAPPWARCLALALPAEGDQTFDALADQLEGRVRPLESFVLFAESFGAPVAVRLAERLGSKVALLVLCNPLVESPLPIAPFFAARLLQSRLMARWMVAHAMTGGDRELAQSVLEEVRALPRDVLSRRLAIACSARRDDLADRLAAPVLGIVGSEDRLVAPGLFQDVLAEVPFAVQAIVTAPHLAAQVAPAAVWAAISEEFQSAA